MSDYLLQEDGTSFLLLEDGGKIILEDGLVPNDLLASLVLHSAYPAFINKNEIIGKFTITGTTVAGANTQTFTLDLGYTPDTIDIIFNGPSDTVRPDSAWFRNGVVSVPFTGTANSEWQLFAKLTSSTLTITALWIQETVGTFTLTDTDFYYKIVNYSVF